MAKQTVKVPGAVLKGLMEEYQLNPNKLGTAVKVNQASIRLITLNKSKITVPLALRLGKFFGNGADFWIKLQIDYELAEAAKNDELAREIKEIEKAKKPLPKEGAKAKTGRGRPSGKTAKDAKAEKAPKEAKVRKPRTPKAEKAPKALRAPRKPRASKVNAGEIPMDYVAEQPEMPSLFPQED